MKETRAFTLIELLVVIAIIGLLSSVVLASLSASRGKGKNASIQQQMTSMRSAVEIFYNNNGGKYNTNATAVTTCDTSTTGEAFSDTTSNMKSILISTVNSATAMDCGITGSAANPQAWSVAATLPSGTGYWCVDSTGAGKSTQGSTATAYTALTGAATAAHTAAGATVCN